MRKDPAERSTEEMQIILKLTGSMRFFKEMNAKPMNVAMKLHEKCCKCFEHEFYKKGQTVFYAGSQPTKFYIILKGSVLVFINKSTQKIAEEKEYLKEHDPHLLAQIKGDILNMRSLSEAMAQTKRLGGDKKKLKYHSQVVGDRFFGADSDESNDSKSSRQSNSIISETSFSSDSEKGDEEMNISVHFKNKKRNSEKEIHEKKLEAKGTMMSVRTLSDEEDEKCFKEIKGGQLSQINQILKNALGGLMPSELDYPQHFFDEGIFRYVHAITLNQGNIFGELGLLMKKPRAATIVCKEDTDFAVLNKNQYHEILSIVEMKKMKARSDFLTEHFFKVSLSLETANKNAYAFTKGKFFQHQVIFNQGDTPDDIFVVIKGEVLVN